MRSIRSRVSSRSLGPDDRGAAVIEFSMIAVMLSAVFFAVLQVGLYLYQRSIVASSAMAGARYAANANVPVAEGGPRARELIADALSTEAAEGLTCTADERQGSNGLRVVVVTCSGAMPSIVTALGALLPMEVTARVIKEGQ